jgi:hypothetical protein
LHELGKHFEQIELNDPNSCAWLISMVDYLIICALNCCDEFLHWFVVMTLCIDLLWCFCDACVFALTHCTLSLTMGRHIIIFASQAGFPSTLLPTVGSGVDRKSLATEDVTSCVVNLLFCMRQPFAFSSLKLFTTACR